MTGPTDPATAQSGPMGAATADTPSAEDRVGALAEEFLGRRRRGERPTIDDYANAHPEHAAEIRRLFPALLMMEDLKPGPGDMTGTFGGVDTVAGTRLERLGDYRILREVGRGGMGVVYEAEQESLGRRVALKVLAVAGVLDPKQRARFEREARAAARLHHTNIVPVFGVGQAGGVHFYVMQFIQGLGLDEVLDEIRRLDRAKSGAPGTAPVPARGVAGRGDISAADVARSLVSGRFLTTPAQTGFDPGGTPLDTPAPVDRTAPSALTGLSAPSISTDSSRRYSSGVARIGLQAAEALAYAHEQGILHRDVKPSNLLLDAHGTVWVADFGLAKAADSDDLTHTGDIVGTLRYMAPERFQGRCDARSDVYALGLTLYELLAKRPAFDEADRGKLIAQVTQGEPCRLRGLDPSLPRDLETVVHKAIECDPAHRYATAGAMAEDLRRFLEDRPIAARRVGSVERLARWGRRNPWVAGLTAAVFLLLALMATGSMIAAMRIQHGKDLALKEASRADAESREARRVADDLRRSQAALRRTLFVSRTKLVQSSWQTDNLAQFKELLDALRPGPGEPDLRGWEWHYWRRQLPDVRLTLDVPEGQLRGAVYSPDGRRLLVLNEARDSISGPARRSRLSLWDAETGRPFGSAETPGASVSTAAFSPDGRRLAVAGTRRVDPESQEGREDAFVSFWEVEPLRRLAEVPVGPVKVSDLVFSPDGLRVSLAGIFSPDGLRVSPAGIRTATGPGTKTRAEIRAWDVASREEVPTFRPEIDGTVRAVALSADLTRLATATQDALEKASAISLWDTATGRLMRTFPVSSASIQQVRLTRDGTRLAAALVVANKPWLRPLGMADRVSVWDTGDGRELLAQVDPGDHQGVATVELSPDGSQLGVGGGLSNLVRVLDLADGRLVLKHAEHRGNNLQVVFSPDGRRILSFSGGNDGHLIDCAISPAASLRLIRPFAQVSSVQFLPDGRHLVVFGRTRPARPEEPVPGDLAWKVVDLEDFRDSGSETTIVGPYSIATLSPDARYVASAYGVPKNDYKATPRPGGVTIHEIDTGRELLRLPATRSRSVHALAYSPDGARLALLMYERPAMIGPPFNGRAMVWDTRDGRELFTLEAPGKGYFADIGFAPDGRRIAMTYHWPVVNEGQTRFRSSVMLFDAADGRHLASLERETGAIETLRFSPDGRRLGATGTVRGNFEYCVHLWDFGEQPARPTLGRLNRPTQALAFSPDGRRIAAASINETLSLLDVESGCEELLSLPVAGGLRGVEFSPDGRRIATFDHDGRVWLIDATPQASRLIPERTRSE